MEGELPQGRRRRNGAKRQRTTTYRAFTLDPVDLTAKPTNTNLSNNSASANEYENHAPVANTQEVNDAENSSSLQTLKPKVEEEKKPKRKKEVIYTRQEAKVAKVKANKTEDIAGGRAARGKQRAEEGSEAEVEFLAEEEVEAAEVQKSQLGEAHAISLEKAFPYLQKKGLRGVDDLDKLEQELSKKDSKTLSHAEHYQKYKLIRLRKKIDKNHKVTDLEFVFAIVNEVIELEAARASSLSATEKKLHKRALELYFEEVKSEFNVYLNRGEDYYQVIQEYKDTKQRVANARQNILEEEKEIRLLKSLLAKEQKLYKEIEERTQSEKAVHMFVEGVGRIVNS